MLIYSIYWYVMIFFVDFKFVKKCFINPYADEQQ